MKHEASYVFTEDYKTVHKVIDRMSDLGYDYRYKELHMADGSVHTFLVSDDEWTEFADMDAMLKWLCSDIFRLKDAYDVGIVQREVSDAEQ